MPLKKIFPKKDNFARIEIIKNMKKPAVRELRMLSPVRIGADFFFLDGFFIAQGSEETGVKIHHSYNPLAVIFFAVYTVLFGLLLFQFFTIRVRGEFKGVTMKLIPIKIVQFCLCLIMVCIAAEGRTAGPEMVAKALEESIGRASKAGVTTQKWQEERQRMIQELLDLELKDAWNKFQLEKTQRYIVSEQENIAVLKQNLARVKKTRNTLSPFLEVLYLDLENHVKNDLPFAVQERERRLAFIRASLDDSTAGLSDKFGRILDAIQVECQYGYTIAVTQEVVEDVDGGSGQVSCFRLGRLGLFRVSAGNSRISRYQKESKTWHDISNADAGEFKKAMEIARKKRVTVVVKLPVVKSIMVKSSMSNSSGERNGGKI